MRTPIQPSSWPLTQQQFTGDEIYVRAKIIDSNGKMAWTQPVRFKGM